MLPEPRASWNFGEGAMGQACTGTAGGTPGCKCPNSSPLAACAPRQPDSKRTRECYPRRTQRGAEGTGRGRGRSAGLENRTNSQLPLCWTCTCWVTVLGGTNVSRKVGSSDPASFGGIYILGTQRRSCAFTQLASVFCTNTRAFALKAAIWKRKLSGDWIA